MVLQKVKVPRPDTGLSQFIIKTRAVQVICEEPTAGTIKYDILAIVQISCNQATHGATHSSTQSVVAISHTLSVRHRDFYQPAARIPVIGSRTLTFSLRPYLPFLIEGIARRAEAREAV